MNEGFCLYSAHLHFIYIYFFFIISCVLVIFKIFWFKLFYAFVFIKKKTAYTFQNKFKSVY